jgi:hypothetical protein
MSTAGERNVIGKLCMSHVSQTRLWPESPLVDELWPLQQYYTKWTWRRYPMVCMNSQNFWVDFAAHYKQAIQVRNFDFLWFRHWCLSVAGGTGIPVLRPRPLKSNMFRNMPTNFRGEEISAHAAIVLCPIGWWCPIRTYNTVCGRILVFWPVLYQGRAGKYVVSKVPCSKLVSLGRGGSAQAN